MIWLVDLAAPGEPRPDAMLGQLITWLQAPRGHRCLVEADEIAESLRQNRHVVSISVASDDLYVDTATRTVWEVFASGTSVRLVGYVPP
jgi:hypothetical protein